VATPAQSKHQIILLQVDNTKVKQLKSIEDDPDIKDVNYRLVSLTNCSLTFANISDSVAENCHFAHSEIKGSMLNGCVLTNCIWDEKTTTKHCQIVRSLGTSKQVSFHRYAPEIRELIFENAVQYGSQMPPLVIALRGDQPLYQEALAAFSKKNEFIYSGSLGHQDVNRAALARIESLTIK
jgi:hypothetical protein